MTTTVVKAIRIDHPWDGDWISAQAGASFCPEVEHCFANHRDGELLGGFVVGGIYMGASATVHMAGKAPGWCSRDLMWMVFDYAFNQQGVRKVIAPVDSANVAALQMDMRAGFELEAVIRDATPTGSLMLLTMTRDRCRWLKHRCNTWRSNPTVVESAP